MTQHLRGQQVAIAGGGIAGLTVALCCARAGAKVRLYERATQIRAFGAGLQITPNGGRVLRALGLEGALEGRSLRSEAVVPTDALSGQVITRFDLRHFTDPPYRLVHRADLIDLLETAARAEGVEIHLDAPVKLVDGQPSLHGQPISGDLVIGAGGLNCPLRAALNPPSEPFFTGQVAWRAVIDGTAPPEGRLWMAPGGHVASYPLHAGRLNIIAVQERRAWAAEGWTHADDPANLRDAFAACGPQLRDLLAQVDTPHLWGLFRHEVAGCWGRGRVAILGDSAHPTLPFMAQGANLALEDAYALAACAAQAPLPEALARYQSLRLARAQRAIGAANANATNFHLRGPRRMASHQVLRALGRFAPGAFIKRLSWLYDYDVTAQAGPLTGA